MSGCVFHAAFPLESSMLDQSDGTFVIVINKCGNTPASQLQEWVIEKTSQEHSGEWCLQCAGHDNICTRILGKHDSTNELLALIANGHIVPVPSDESRKPIPYPVCNSRIFSIDKPRAALRGYRDSWLRTIDPQFLKAVC